MSRLEGLWRRCAALFRTDSDSEGTESKTEADADPNADGEGARSAGDAAAVEATGSPGQPSERATADGDASDAARGDPSAVLANADVHGKGPGAAAADAGEAGTEETDADAVRERSVADDDQVLRILIKSDGRVERETLAERTDWEEERLEAVLEEMSDEGQISLVPHNGREVVCRFGYEPPGHRGVFEGRRTRQ